MSGFQKSPTTPRSQKSPTSTSDFHDSPTYNPSDSPSRQTSTNPPTPIDRSTGRNVHIYHAEDPTVVLGGLLVTNGVTNAIFYAMIEILVTFTDHFFLRDEEGTQIEKNNSPLLPGKYYIVSIGGFLHHPPMVA
jgi:hypothetical protein